MRLGEIVYKFALNGWEKLMQNDFQPTNEYEKLYFLGDNGVWYYSDNKVKNFDDVTEYLNNLISERKSFDNIFVSFTDGSMVSVLDQLNPISESRKMLIALRSVKYQQTA